MADFTQMFLQGLQAGQSQKEAMLRHEKEKEDRDLQRQMLKHQMDRLKIEGQIKDRQFQQDSAKAQFDFMQGAPAPVGDVSQGVSGVQGGGQFDLAAAIAAAQQGQTAPRMDTSGMQPLGQHAPIAMPGAEGQPTVYRTPETQQQLQQRLAGEQVQKAQIDLRAAFGKAWAEAEGRNSATPAPMTEYQRAQLNKPDTVQLAIAAAQGDPTAQKALSLMKPPKESDPTVANDAESIADAIISGDAPPSLAGLYRYRGPVQAALSRKNYNLTKPNLDWEATRKHLATMNGAKQTTLRQAVDTAYDSLDIIDSLAREWKGGGFKVLNKAQLALAKNGVLGPKARDIATALEGQITDVVSELGQVYMGGNSPTDHALKLAEKNLSANWDEGTLLRMTNLARQNLAVRRNSIRNSGVITTSNLDGMGKTAPKTGKMVQNPDGTWEMK